MVINLKIKRTDILGRSRSLMQYYEEVRKYPVLTQQQENQLFDKIYGGDRKEAEKAAKMLLNCNQRFVIAVARRFASQNNLSDLISEGNIGLINAIGKYDRTKNYKFATYAVWYIRKAMNDYILYSDKLIKRANISKTYHPVSSARKRFIMENERLPTKEELKDILEEEYGIRVPDSNDLVEVQLDYIDDCTVNSDFEEYSASDFEVRTASYNEVDEKFEREELSSFTDELMECLSDRERFVVCRAFGIGCSHEHSTDEIAAEMNITVERVRQIRRNGMEKLKSYANGMIPLDAYLERRNKM